MKYFLIGSFIQVIIWIGLYYILKNVDMDFLYKYIIIFLVAELYGSISSINMITRKKKEGN